MIFNLVGKNRENTYSIFLKTEVGYFLKNLFSYLSFCANFKKVNSGIFIFYLNILYFLVTDHITSL